MSSTNGTSPTASKWLSYGSKVLQNLPEIAKNIQQIWKLVKEIKTAANPTVTVTPSIAENLSEIRDIVLRGSRLAAEGEVDIVLPEIPSRTADIPSFFRALTPFIREMADWTNEYGDSAYLILISGGIDVNKMNQQRIPDVVQLNLPRVAAWSVIDNGGAAALEANNEHLDGYLENYPLTFRDSGDIEALTQFAPSRTLPGATKWKATYKNFLNVLGRILPDAQVVSSRGTVVGKAGEWYYSRPNSTFNPVVQYHPVPNGYPSGNVTTWVESIAVPGPTWSLNAYQGVLPSAPLDSMWTPQAMNLANMSGIHSVAIRAGSAADNFTAFPITQSNTLPASTFPDLGDLQNIADNVAMAIETSFDSTDPQEPPIYPAQVSDLPKNTIYQWSHELDVVCAVTRGNPGVGVWVPGAPTFMKFWIQAQWFENGVVVRKAWPLFARRSLDPQYDILSYNSFVANKRIRVPAGRKVYLSMRVEADGDRRVLNTGNGSMAIKMTISDVVPVGTFRRVSQVNQADVSYLLYGESIYRTLSDTNDVRFSSFIGRLIGGVSDDPIASVDQLWLDYIGGNEAADTINEMIFDLANFALEKGSVGFDVNRRYRELTGDDTFTVDRFIPITRWLERPEDANLPGPFFKAGDASFTRLSSSTISEMIYTLFYQLYYFADGIQNNQTMSDFWQKEHVFPSLSFNFGGNLLTS